MMNEKTYHLINDYLNGNLTGRALDKFKADLKENVELQEAVEMQQAIIDSIQSVREKELKANLQDNLKKGPKTIVMTSTMRVVLSTAAAITLLVSTFFVFRQYMDNQAPLVATEQAEDSEEILTLENSKQEQDSVPLNNPEITEVHKETLAMANTPVLDSLNNYVKPLEVVEDEEMESDLAEENIPNPSLELDIAKDEDGVTDQFDGYVKTDEMLSNKYYAVNTISFTFKAPVTPTDNVTQSDVKVATSKRADKKEKEYRYDDTSDLISGYKSGNLGEQESEKSSVVSVRNIEVEYWKSVVNYKGYNYDGNKVKLYGIEENKELIFKELDNRLYVEVEGKQYFIENNKSYNRLVEVTNPTLLGVLNDK
jgi:hypothetical protein